MLVLVKPEVSLPLRLSPINSRESLLGRRAVEVSLPLRLSPINSERGFFTERDESLTAFAAVSD